MKILLLTPDLPFPSESGAAIRNIGLIRGLSAAGQRLTLLSFAEKPVKPAGNPLFQLCDAVRSAPLPPHGKLKRVIKLLASAEADMKFRLSSAEFQQSLRKLLGESEFDLIQFSGLELGCCLPLIQQCKGSAKVVYDALNAEAELQRIVAQVDRGDWRRLPMALYSAMQSRRLASFEREICRGVDGVIAVSQEDRAMLRRLGGAPVVLVPNGVDAADYAPAAGGTRAPNRLLFSGKMDYRPNVDAAEWFCDAVLPRIRHERADARLLIVGRNPHRRLRKLRSAPGIEVTGWVESVQPYLQRAAIYVAPLRMGSGTRLKILQAMAAGCAVVTTSIGAAGLNEDLRQALVIADEARDFAQAVVALLADETRRDELGRRARTQVARHYDWSALTPRLLRAYAELGIG